MRGSHGLYRAFNAAFGVLCLGLLALCALAWQYNRFAAAATGAVLCAALAAAAALLAPRLDAMPARRFRALFWGAAAVYLAALLVLGNLMAEVLISDMGVVYDTLREFLAAGHPVENNDYYIICNNNLGLALVLYGWYTLVGVLGVQPDAGAGITAGIVLNCLAIFAAVLLLAFAAERATGRQSTRLGLLALAALFAPLYLWAPYFYSDTLCLPFLAGAVALAGAYRQKPRLWLGAALGAAVAVGTAIKGSVAVLAVAACIALLIERPAGLRHAALTCAALVLSLAVLLGGYRVWQRGYLDWTNEDAVSFPTELWLCYGSHEAGDYNDADAQACKEAATLAQRRELMRAAILQNYGSRTLVGNLAFEARKAVRTWGDGEYGAAEYLATPLHANLTARFTLAGQPGYMPLKYYCQAWQYALLGLTGLGALLAARRKAGCDAGFMARIGLFGAMLFFSFWETKARYALHFAPVLLFLAVLTLAELGRWLRER